ncbi:hypothetical protein H072_1482 [Dactylellina haptotyla CBS 200.50]|uniref:Serine hydrolase domain-containing protein n=1 Tax=Dactylellina haptotyla (strain CBS 200.50) TaxID=1284197 RepID=S8BYE5_DACHA|nr:hypothetical protein H072_1482 [Dactylellina haptotyla CBS 200.50]
MAEAPKILMLHGKTQSGEFFRAKTRALEKQIIDTCGCFPTRPQFYYPTAPHRLYLGDIPDVNPALVQLDEESGEMYSWWKGDDHTGDYKGAEETWSFLSEYLDKNGPFTGVVAFSQGASLGVMLASILEPSRRQPEGFTSTHPPFKFVVAYCGFRVQSDEYNSLYEPKIQTPVFSFLGTYDTVVEEKHTRQLVQACEGSKLMQHPGGHYVVVKKPYLTAVSNFINETITGRPSSAGSQTDDIEITIDSPASGTSTPDSSRGRIQYRFRRRYAHSVTRERISSKTHSPRSISAYNTPRSAAGYVPLGPNMPAFSQADADRSNSLRFAVLP